MSKCKHLELIKMVQARERQKKRTHPGIEQAIVELADRDPEIAKLSQIVTNKGLPKTKQVEVLSLLQHYSSDLPTEEELKFWLDDKQLEVEFLGLSEWRVTNLKKGSAYVVTECYGIYQCECEAASWGNECSHMKAMRFHVKDHPEQLSKEPEWEPDTTEVSSELATLASEQTIVDDEWEVIETTIEVSEHPFRFDELPGFDPTESQRRAIVEIASFLSGHESHHLLQGAAGTGKTTVLQFLITALRQYGDRRRIVFTAPTNQAVKVLRKMAERWGISGVDAMTCHKLLGLKAKKREKKLYFEPDPKNPGEIDNYDLVGVDELSMLSEGSWNHLNRGLKLGQKALFMGDRYQAPPVGEPLSRAFLDITSVTTLTEIKRYDGAIGDLAEALRLTIEPANLTLPEIQSFDNIQRCNSKTFDFQQIVAFKSKQFQDNPNYARVVAYSNKRVKQTNDRIRAAIYGDAPQFVVGERLIAQEAYAPFEEVLIQTSEECEVIGARKGSVDGWDVWFLEVKPDDSPACVVQVLQAEECDRFARKLNELAESRRWYEYWTLREQFADLRYPYAITCHKAQGMTFPLVFLDLYNFTNTYQWIVKSLSPKQAIEKIRERNQLLYTAVTRTAEKLFVQ